jgi:hypothetical protein
VLDRLAGEIDVEAHVASRQLDVRPSSETYLRDGRFSLPDMVALYEHFVTSATADGGTARIAGEGAWAAEGHPGTEDLVDYEIELNRMMRRHPQTILCLYDLAVLGGAMMVDLLKTHPKILLGGMLIENPHYLTPEEFMRTRRTDPPADPRSGPGRLAMSAQPERGGDGGTRTLARQGVDVDDKAVVDRQQDERQHLVVAQGDDADPIADG